MYGNMFELKWIYGGPWDLWINQADVIDRFIRENKLAAMAPEHIPVHPLMMPEPLAVHAKTLPRPIPFPGGMRGPHLHFKGEIFRLTPEQWKSFSAAVIERYREKLGRVGTVSFDGLMDLAAGVEHL